MKIVPLNYSPHLLGPVQSQNISPFHSPSLAPLISFHLWRFPVTASLFHLLPVGSRGFGSDLSAGRCRRSRPELRRFVLHNCPLWTLIKSLSSEPERRGRVGGWKRLPSPIWRWFSFCIPQNKKTNLIPMALICHSFSLFSMLPPKSNSHCHQMSSTVSGKFWRSKGGKRVKIAPAKSC